MANIPKLRESLDHWLNIVAKWRQIYAGWQFGTRPVDDPECRAVRDTQEARLLLRVEVNAITGLLIKKGVFTEIEWMEQLIEEAKAYNDVLEKRWPGAKASPEGMHIDIQQAQAWMSKFRP